MSSLIEDMKSFFDARAAGYDKHMLENVKATKNIYEIVGSQVEKMQATINIVDLGCGTGLELNWLFAKAPAAVITGIDISDGMLLKLQEKYADKVGQLRLITGSYLDIPLGKDYYDYAVSVMSLHHFLHAEKLGIYRRVYDSLKPGAKYIEGDYTVSTPEEEKQFIAEADEIRKLNNLRDGLYHIDIPFTVETQVQLLKKAGFRQVEVVWMIDNASVIVGHK